MGDTSGNFDRLKRALEVFADWEEDGRSVSPQQLLANHPDLHEVLEPLVHGSESGTDEAPEPRSEETGPEREVPDELGGFRIEGEIGRGGMGVVYAARQIALDRQVALKVLPTSSQISARAVARFRRESALLASLNHPGLVEVLTVGRDQGFEFFAMELVDGVPLNRVLRELGREDLDSVDGSRFGSTVQGLFDQSQLRGLRAAKASDTSTSTWTSTTSSRSYFESVAKIVHQIADALHHAHEAGVLHRDVKPSNILLRPDGRAVLTDFGLAREVGRPSLTHSGEFAGTPFYASPEQVLGRSKDLDRRADVFSLGIVLYELATLKRPFDGANAHEVSQSVLTQEPADPSRLRRRIPNDLAAIALRAIEKSPNRRYQSARELADDLDAFLHHRSVRARKAGPWRRTVRFCQRSPLKATLALVLATAIPAIGFLSGYLIARQPVLEAGETELREQKIDELLEAGSIEIENGREEALAIVGRALELDPEHPEALGLWLMAVGKLQGRARAFEELEKIRPSERLPATALTRFRIALLRTSGNDEEADRLSEDLPRPTTMIEAFYDGLAKLTIGHKTERNEDYRAAVRAFDLAILLAPRQRPILTHHLAHAIGHARMRARSSDIAHALTTLRPDSLVSNWWAYYVEVGTNLPRAHEKLRRVIEMDPDNPRFPYTYGTQLMRLGKYEQAIEPLQRAGTVDPNYSEAHSNLAHVLTRLDRNEEALQSIEKAIQANPQRAMFRSNKAQILITLGRAAEAKEALEQALRLDPNEAIALSAMARLKLEQDGAEACRDFCREQIEAGRHYEHLYARLAACCEELGEMDAARSALEAGMEHFEESTKLLNRHAQLLTTTDPKAARRSAERSLTLDPNQPEVWQVIGPLRARSGDREGAVQAFQRRLEDAPDDRLTRQNLAIYQAMLGNKDEALKTMEELVRRAPDWPKAHENKSRLLTDMNRFEDAIAAAEIGLESFADDEGLHVQIAFIHWRQAIAFKRKGDDDSARVEVDAGLKRLGDFDGKRAKDVRGRLSKVLGD